MSQTFGQQLREARQSKGYSQRELASLVGVNYTYLSKLENNRSDYPPKEDIIQALAQHLELDATELGYLAGRITAEDAKAVQDLAKQYQKQMPVLLRKMQDPKFAEKLIKDIKQAQAEEKS